MNAEDFRTLLLAVPPDQRRARASTFLECATHLVIETPKVEGKYRQYILEVIAGAEAVMGYGSIPNASLRTVYVYCVDAGVPKDQMDALVALHLT